MAENRANNPRRVPQISFPGPSTIRPGGPLHLDNTDRIKDRYIPGSRNPIIDMMDEDDLVNLRRDDNNRGSE